MIVQNGKKLLKPSTAMVLQSIHAGHINAQSTDTLPTPSVVSGGRAPDYMTSVMDYHSSHMIKSPSHQFPFVIGDQRLSVTAQSEYCEFSASMLSTQ